MIRIGLLVLCILFFTGSAAGQNTVIDSLVALLPTTTAPKDKVTLLHRLAAESWDYSFDQGLKYAQEAYQLSRANNYPQGLVESLTDIGQYYYFTGDYTTAQSKYREALMLAGENNFGEYPAHTFIRLGNLFRVQAEFDSALRYYNQAEYYLADGKSKRTIAYLSHNKGLLEYEQGDFKGAIKKFKKALSIRLKFSDSLVIAESWKQMGIGYASLSVLDSAEYYFKKVYGMATRMNNPELSIFYHLHHGDLLFVQGDFIGASESYLKANDLLAGHDFFRYRALIYKSIGALFEWRGDYQRALEYLLKALSINEKLGSKQEIAKIYNSIGWMYVNQGNFDKAMAYNNQSLEIMKRIKDQFGISTAHTLKGQIFSRQNKLLLAQRHYDSAILIRLASGAQLPLANSLSFRADVFLKSNQLALAQADLTRVLAIADEYPSKIVTARAWNRLSIVYVRQGDITRALSSTEKARAIATAIESIPELRKSYLNQIEIFTVTGQKDNVIKAYDRYIKLTDSLLNSESLEKQAQLNVLYQLDKSESEIRLLNQENLLKQNQIVAQSERIRSQNYLIILFITASVLLVALAYILFYYSRLKKRDNEKLLRLNQEIQEKNEEIQTQSEELVEANKILYRLNNDLMEKQEEVKSQAEELIVSNEQINRINQDLEAMVQKRTAQLQSAYNELDIFFYRSSHDFRRPLTTFLGLAEVASVTVKDKNALELFVKVKETAESLDKMLFKLQSISDIGSQQLIYKEVRLKDLLYELTDLFKTEVENRKIRVQIDLETGKHFYANPVLLKIILENLLENAIYFGHPENPIIQISATYNQTHVTISIEDNGQGITAEHQDRIFEMYFRANERSKGNGLGLYIVKKALDKINGRITFKSTLHQGSTFIVQLPLS